MATTLYWKSTCTTCRTARAWLQERDVPFVDRNYARTPLRPEEVREILAAAGGVGAVVNLRHELAKARDWKTKLPSEAEFVNAAVEDVNLLRRPILVKGKRAVVGKDEAGFETLLR